MDSLQPPTSAAATWKSNTNYSLGDSVVGSDHKTYIVVGAGYSGANEPVPSGNPGQPIATISDGDLVWMDIGRGSGRPAWLPNHDYPLDFAVSGANGHDYQVIRFTAGISGLAPAGKSQPDFPILHPGTVIEVAKETIPDDHGITWVDLGVIRPADIPSATRQWRPKEPYQPNEVIFVPGIGNGRYYRASYVRTGDALKAGDTSPFLDLGRSFPLTWQSSGTTAPASVASGQPSDQTVSLINLGLPQTHSLSYFNVSAGVIGGFNRSPTFGFLPATNQLKAAGTMPTSAAPTGAKLALDPATGCTVDAPTVPAAAMSNSYYCPANLGPGPRTVDPVLVLTFYFPPVDAERQLRLTNWRDWVPGLSFGASLANPTSNFYLGGSNEIGVRNVQLFYGWGWQKTAKGLANLGSQPLFGELVLLRLSQRCRALWEVLSWG